MASPERPSRKHSFSLREEIQQLFLFQAWNKDSPSVEDGLHHLFLLILKRENLFLDRAPRNKFVTGDNVLLPDPVGPVGGLRFDCRVPPRVEVDHSIRSSEIQADSSSFQLDQEDGSIPLLKLFDHLSTFFSGTI